MKDVLWLATSMTIIGLLTTASGEGSPERPCYDGPAAVVVNQDADIYIGILLNMREMVEIPARCGALHRDAVELYESLRWYLSFINKNSGQVASRLVTDSYVPGIKLGLKIFDACGDADLAERQLELLFPELRAADADCQINDEHSIIGLIDFIALTDYAHINQQLTWHSIPFVSIQLDDFLPADEVAQALLQFSRQMSWQKVSVIYAEDDYSLAITRAIDQKAEAAGICFESYTKVTDDVVALDGDTNTTAFLVVSPPEDAQNITRFLLSNGKERHYQWIFSHPWSAEETDLLEELAVESDVYALAVSPVMVKLFEQYWNKRKNPALAPTAENYWTLEYLANLKKCHLESVPSDPHWLPCHNFNVEETPLASVLSHSRILPAVHALNTFAYALRAARNLKCHQLTGYCDDLRMLSRQEFVRDIFNTMEVQHNGPGNRVPTGFVGSKKSSSNQIADVKISLIRSQVSSVQELMTYQKDSGLDVMDASFVAIKMSCPSHGCSYCVRFQPTPSIQVDDKTDIIVTQQMSIPADHSGGGWTATVHEVDSDGSPLLQPTLSSVNNELGSAAAPLAEDWDNSIIIPALFPVHRAGPTPLQCSAEIDVEAIQNIEAFLWSLDLINANAWLLNGLEMGTVIFDTCSSPLKAAHLVSSIMTQEGDDDMLPEMDPRHLLTVVAATSGEETDAVVAVLAPSDVTTISAKDRSVWNYETPYRLQVAVPVNEAAEALVDLLLYYGWNDVNVVSSHRDADSAAGLRHFRQLAENTPICIGWEEMINDTGSVQALDQLFDQLASQTESGSGVVILWTNRADTEAILYGTDLLTPKLVKEHGESIVWIDANGWIAEPKLHNSVNYVGTWLAIRPELNLVKDFAVHMAQLRPESNERNPWYREFWDQLEGCTADCDRMKRIHPSTTTVIQSVYALASGLARLMEEYCPNQRLFAGSCSTNSTQFRQTLFGYLKMTGTDRPDGDADEEFAFTESGYGDTGLQVVRIRPDFPQGTASGAKMVTVGQYRHGKLVMEADFDGFAIVSECRAAGCAGCVAKRQNQMLMQSSRDQLYILGLFDVRRKSANDMWTCGVNITSRGIRHTEAFLWALNHINSSPNVLPGVQLGAVGLDGCSTQRKRTTDLAKLFSGDPAHPQPVDGRKIAAMVVASPDVDPGVLDDLHQRQGMAILLSAPQGSALQGSAPLLQLSPPSSALMGRALAELLRRMGASRVSLVCSTQLMPYRAVCDELRRNYSAGSDTTLAVDWSVRPLNHSADYWADAAAEISDRAQQGVSILIALLPGFQLSPLLSAVEYRNSPPLLLMTLATEQEFAARWIDQMPVLSSVISVGVRKSRPGSFYEDAPKNMIRLNGSNPWLAPFWTQQLQCRGAACHHLDDRYIHHMNQVMVGDVDDDDDDDRTVSNVINGVVAVAQALEAMRKEMCPELEEGICPAMTAEPEFRPRLERYIKENSLEDINGQPMSFDQGSGWNRDTVVDIINIRQSAKGNRVQSLGTFSTSHGLDIQLTNDLIQPTTSTTSTTSTTPPTSTISSTPPSPWQPTEFMRIPSGSQSGDSGFWLVGFLAFHRKGLEPLSCGAMTSSRVFQNLAAVAMVLDGLRRNDSVPQALQVGALLFDSCSSTRRVQQRISSILSNQIDNGTSVIAGLSHPIGVISLELETAQAVAGSLDEINIGQFSTVIDGFRTPAEQKVPSSANQWHSVSDQRIYQTVPTAEDQVRAIFDIIVNLNWKHLVLFYDDTASGSSDRDILLGYIRVTDVCVGAQIRVSPYPAPGPTHIRSILKAIASDLPDLSVAVFLLDTPAQVKHVLSVLQDLELSHRFVVVSNDAWGSHVDLLHEPSVHQLAGVLTVSMETYRLPAFDRYLADLSLDSHSSIPDDWFQEYYQHRYECYLPHSRVPQTVYTDRCVASDHLQVRDIQQDPYVYHTVQAVETFVKALDQFLRFHCPAGMDARKLSDCGPQSSERFAYILNDVVKRRQLQGASSGVGGLNVWNAQHHIHGREERSDYKRVGLWRRGGQLDLEKTQMKFYVPYVALPVVECVKGACKAVCSTQSSSTSTSFRPIADQVDVAEAAKTSFSPSPAWTVIATLICVVGLAAVAGCVTYLVRSPEKLTPAATINYIILSGIALLYVATIFSLVTPSNGWCAVRRFLPGVAYGAIFAGLLVRSIHNWRRSTASERPTGTVFGSEASSGLSLDSSDEATGPTGMVFITLTLVAVQVVLLSAGLMFKPPLAVMTQGGLWRCAPVDSFESQLVLLLVLPIILLFAATVFSLLAMRSVDADKDSRSMMASCALVSFTTAIWTLVATQAPFHFRGPATVVGNILCAKLILVILYGRKVYQISANRQESRNLAVLSQFTRRPKTLQPTLQSFATTRSITTMYATDLDGPCGLRNESFALESDRTSQGLTLDLSSARMDASGKPSRSLVKRSQSLQGHSLRHFQCLDADHEDMFATQIVPYPVYPMTATRRNSVKIEEGVGENSDVEEAAIKYRCNSVPQSRRGSLEQLNDVHQPVVRRVGSRQMLVLGDDTSGIHGRVSKI